MTQDPVLAVAVRAARRAAAVIADAARDLKRLPSHARQQGELIANASGEAENAIIATLRTAFPEHAIVGKESGDIVSQIDAGATARRAFQWIVDPLDGAANFAHGYPHYAVSLALTHGSDVTHAVVLDPARDELYAAVKGRGAELNDTPIRTSMCTALEHALVGTAIPSRDSPQLPAYRSLLQALESKYGGLRRAGACALDLAYVGAGRLDAFWMTGGKPWDVVAGALIVTEAGGRVGNFSGGVDYLRTNEVIAAAAGLFNPLREAIATAQR
jgi:myo-inositol-1(or 4)-monophosphatase